MGEHGKHRVLVRLLALAVAALAPSVARALDCAAALVLALDVSSSVDSREHALQMQGLAAAFRDPAVVETILSGPGAGIMASAFLWSGFQHQEVIVGWTWLGDAQAVAGFADALAAAPRRYDHWPTALGRAVGFAAELHKTSPLPCRRRLVDVSGDGANNDGVEADWYADQGALDGLTVNGLVIRGADPDPALHYRDHVLYGPGAFMEVIEGYAGYPPAILRKLLRELSPPYAMDAR